jgi:hypothetical protein
MPVLKGHTSGSITSTAYNIAATIKSFTLVDKSGAGATVVVAIVENGDQVYIDRQALTANQAYKTDVEIKLKSGFSILIITSAAIDYYFSIE